MLRKRIIATATLATLALIPAGCAKSSTDAGGFVPVPSSAPRITDATPSVAPTAKATKTTGSTGTSGTSGNSDWPNNVDCVSYNPKNLTVDGTGATGTFLVEAGSTIVIRVHGDQDIVGQQALALAQRYSEHCYLGRTNTMDPKGDYIFDYWRNPSGMTPTIPDPDDNLCSPYNNKNLTVEDMGDGNGWRVKDHDHVLQLFQNKTDADNGNLVLRKYSQVCDIGDSVDSDNGLGQVDFQR